MGHDDRRFPEVGQHLGEDLGVVAEPSRLQRGVAVPGTVERQRAHARVGEELLDRGPDLGPARLAMEEHHRPSGALTPDREGARVDEGAGLDRL